MTIRGTVNALRYVQIPITLRGAGGKPDKTLDVLIDTGFDGALSLPPALIAELGLPYSRQVSSLTFSGEPVEFPSHDAIVVLGTYQQGVACLGADIPPLVGMGLLDGFDLFIEIKDNGSVILTRQLPQAEEENL